MVYVVWPTARRRAVCFCSFLHIVWGWGGVGLITSWALRSHTHAGLVYVLVQFHRCIMPAAHTSTWAGWGGWGGANNVRRCACSHACCSGYVLSSPAIPLILLKLTISLRYVLFVGNMFPTLQGHKCYIERTWQNLKGFLPKPMCLKYKDKGQSKMHPSVPEYILYIYIYT